MVIGPGQISFSIVLIKIDKYFYMLFTCCCNFPPVIFIDFMVIIFDGWIRCRRFRVGVEEAGERGAQSRTPGLEPGLPRALHRGVASGALRAHFQTSLCAQGLRVRMQGQPFGCIRKNTA